MRARRRATRGVERAERPRPARALLLADAGHRPALLGDTLDDAEDAYQRAAEILLTKAPDRPAEDMCRWLRTTVKHEASHPPPARASGAARGAGARARAAHRPARHPRTRGALRRACASAPGAGAAQAAGGPCLLLKAEGYSYKRDLRANGLLIHEGGSLPEGGPPGVHRPAGGHRGGRRVQPGGAGALRAGGRRGHRRTSHGRPHLRSCLSCRATLREYRARRPASRRSCRPRRSRPAAARMAGCWRSRVAARRRAPGHRAGRGQKAAAVAASAAALAGGGAGVWMAWRGTRMRWRSRTTLSRSRAPLRASRRPW